MQLPYGFNWDAWYAWAQETRRRILDQEDRIACLERELKELAARMDAANQKPHYSIERLEYHFDQLKVEKLEGTLNIGMQSPGEESLPGVDQFSIPETAPKPGTYSFPSAGPGAVQPTPSYYTNVRDIVERYLQDEASQRIAAIENELGIPLDPHHRRIIIEDIRRQMPARIQYYLRNASHSGGGTAVPDAIIHDAAAKSIRDCETAMRQYLLRLKQPPEQQDEGDAS